MRTVSRHLPARRFLLSRRPGAQSALAPRTVPMVVVEQKEEKGRRRKVRQGILGLKRHSREKLTTADLVLLSLLAEQPMHGYQANRELQRREIRDWAAISRPQVYYSMEKLARLGFLRKVQTSTAA